MTDSLRDTFLSKRGEILEALNHKFGAVLAVARTGQNRYDAAGLYDSIALDIVSAFAPQLENIGEESVRISASKVAGQVTKEIAYEFLGPVVYSDVLLATNGQARGEPNISPQHAMYTL